MCWKLGAAQRDPYAGQRPTHRHKQRPIVAGLITRPDPAIAVATTVAEKGTPLRVDLTYSGMIAERLRFALTGRAGVDVNPTLRMAMAMRVQGFGRPRRR